MFISDMVDHIADNVKPTDAGLPDAEAWMELLRHQMEKAAMEKNDMGTFESLIQERVKDLAGPLLQYGVQLLADQQEMLCPQCGSELNVEDHKRERTVTTIFGKVTFKRSYGYCKACNERFYPADHALQRHRHRRACRRSAR